MVQGELFNLPASQPEGFRYQPDFISAAEESAIVRELAGLPFKEFEFRGYLGKRRVVSYGWRYDFDGGGLQKTDDFPDFLLPLRDRASLFAGGELVRLRQVLVTEYGPGAAIGWHRDRSAFGEVVGISLLSKCTFRLRRKVDEGWQRSSLELQPRSAYLLRGPVRTDWEHSIPAVANLRYSITFRTVKNLPPQEAFEELVPG